MEAFLGKVWKVIRQFQWTWNWLIRTAFQDRKSYVRETSGSGNKIEQDMDNREKGKRKSREKEKRGRLPWWLSGKESACQCKRHVFDSWSKKISHTAEPMLCSYWAYTLEPRSCNYRAHMPEGPYSETREATAMRNLGTTTREQPLLTTTREKPWQQQRLNTAKTKYK